MLVAGMRMTGRYSDCGKGFATLGKRLGRHIAGKPMCLFYDGEYRDDDANFEPCMPMRKPVEADGISVRELPGGRCVDADASRAVRRTEPLVCPRDAIREGARLSNSSAADARGVSSRARA